jgi:5-oxoprolinase (ATP-hydrolysing) subunit A
MDLNADLGEGFGPWRMGDDDALLKIVTSANVACGFHGGDPVTMRAVCATAAAHGVAVGAHVAYRDLAGFGRRYMAYEPDELTADVLYQIAALDGIARAAGTAVSYVKPHGALYHAAASDPVQAQAVLAAVRAYDPDLAVLSLPGAALLAAAEAAGLTGVPEAFLDRAYRPDGGLVPRGQPGAVIHDAAEVAARAVRLAGDGTVVAVDGSVVPVRAGSLCVHGDTPAAVALAERVRAELVAAGIRLTPFTGRDGAPRTRR